MTHIINFCYVTLCNYGNVCPETAQNTSTMRESVSRAVIPGLPRQNYLVATTYNHAPTS